MKAAFVLLASVGAATILACGSSTTVNEIVEQADSGSVLDATPDTSAGNAVDAGQVNDASNSAPDASEDADVADSGQDGSAESTSDSGADAATDAAVDSGIPTSSQVDDRLIGYWVGGGGSAYLNVSSSGNTMNTGYLYQYILPYNTTYAQEDDGSIFVEGSSLTFTYNASSCATDESCPSPYVESYSISADGNTLTTIQYPNGNESKGQWTRASSFQMNWGTACYVAGSGSVPEPVTPF